MSIPQIRNGRLVSDPNLQVVRQSPAIRLQPKRVSIVKKPLGIAWFVGEKIYFDIDSESYVNYKTESAVYVGVVTERSEAFMTSAKLWNL